MDTPFDRVTARGVSKVYGRQRALGSVSLELGAGEAVALLGPNGAGKSTLLGILGTLVRPSTGELLFSDEPPTAWHRAGIGVLGHESLCYAELTGRENLHFFARLYGVARPAERSAEWLARLGIEHAADRPARTYSRGMLQRLALGRALIHGPRLLLLDEPFTGLDREGVALLRSLLMAERDRGAILLIISHEFASLVDLATRALVLRRGRLVHDGPAPVTADGWRVLYEEQGSSAAPAMPAAQPAEAANRTASPGGAGG